MDTTTTGLRHSQVAHILPSTSDGGSDAESREDPASLGLEYRETRQAREEPVSLSPELLSGEL